MAAFRTNRYDLDKQPQVLVPHSLVFVFNYRARGSLGAPERISAFLMPRQLRGTSLSERGAYSTPELEGRVGQGQNIRGS